MPELIERYLAELERRLPGRRGLRRRAIAEASRHLHDAFADEQAAGLDEQAAEQRAIDRFGPARDVADAFRASLPVRHVTTRRVAALVTAGLAAALIATVVQETSTPDSTPRAPQAEAAAEPAVSPSREGPPRGDGKGREIGSGAGVPEPALAAVSPPAAGGAVWRFSSWEAGAPGVRASGEVRERFRRRAARSVHPLPAGAPVKRVLSAMVDGVRYDVFGARVAGVVCLELRRSGWRIASYGCATLAGLQADPTRWVLLPDMRLGPRLRDGAAPRVTLGFVPDGADPVQLVRTDGRVKAVVSGNVFLAVARAPQPRSSARRLVIRASGETVKVPVRTPGVSSPVRSDPVALGGPTRIDRFPSDGTIGWLARAEQRGAPIPPGYLPAGMTGGIFTPDPLSADAIVAFRRPDTTRFPLPLDAIAGDVDNEDLCVGLAEQGQQMTRAICGNRPGTPFIGFVSIAGFTDGHLRTYGLVTDDVAQLEAYVGPDPIPVAIADNVVLLTLPAWPKLVPFKLVAYDAAGQVIGIIPDQPDFGTSPQRPDETQRHTVIDLTQAAGIAARLDAAPSNQDGTCWWLTLGSRTTTGCVPREPHRQTPGWPGIGPQWTRNGPRFVFGAPAAPIDSLALRLANGTETPIPIVEGLALALLPAGVDAKGDAEVVGRDTTGNEIAHVDAFTGEILLREPTTPPIQTATGRGIQLRVYQDPFSDRALLALDTRRADPAVRAVLTPRRDPTDRRTGIDCYRTGDDGINTGHGVLADADTLAVVGMPLRTPLDACELPGSNGKAWRDRWNGRPVVELALTERGRRYLAERDTARDLGLFLRTPAMRAIRAHRGKAPAAAEIAARYPAGTVMALARRDETPPAGVVGVWTSGARVTVVEQSPAGTRYVADLDEGRIVGGNLSRPIRIPQGETASPQRTTSAIPGPALLVSRAGPGRSWRLSDDSVLFTSRQRIQSLDRPGIETTIPLASLGSLAPDANRLAVVDAKLNLRLLDPATLATTTAIPLGPTVTGPTVRQPRRDTSTGAGLLPWRAPDTIAVLVSRIRPRNRLDRRELLLVDPASGTVRARVDVTRYRALLATATTSRAVLLLMRDRRGSNPYVLVRITNDGRLDTVDLPQRLVGGVPGTLPVDPTGNRAFTIGREGRIGEIDLTTLTVREHDLGTDLFHPWTFATPNDLGTVGDGALPLIARYRDSIYRPALVDTRAWRLTSFLTDAEPQGPPPASAGLALVGGFSGLCGSCGAGLTAYATDGTPRWHALGTRLVANTQSASSVTLVVLNHATRTGTRLFLLDTRTGRTLAQLPATRYPGWVQLLAP